MNKSLIKNYAESITKEKILNFSSKQGFSLTNNELNIIYDAIKNDIDILLSDQSEAYLESKKYSLSPKVYTKILEYKERYLRYFI